MMLTMKAARIAGGCLGLAKSGSLRRANRLSRLEVPRAIQDMKKSTSTSTPVEDLDAGDEDSVTDTTSSSTPTTTAVPAEAGVFTGGVEIPFTSQLRLIDPAHFPVWPVYRVLDNDGSVRADAVEPELKPELAVKVYENMVRLEAMDDIFYSAQRQGRMSFYAQSAGEEGVQMAGAAALELEDIAFTQYREPGILMWRGFSVQDFADQCFGNCNDLGKAGRQMPVHYGSEDFHFQTVSSPLATQIPQAVGAGYALKLSGQKNVAVCYFGEGAASEGDFHAAMMMAATRDVPIIFVCRNNGYAISTSVEEQYRGDGIVSRAPGYGMPGIRVDGNDVLAVYAAMAEARRLCLSENKPVLMEAMTYRLGHHSTSDDASRYRCSSEVEEWKVEHHPIRRFRAYLQRKGWWDDDKDRALREKERLTVLNALEKAERKGKPSVDTMFEDVYKVMPPHLQEQRDHLYSHMERHPGQYETKH
ncbi:unnamed protein product [Ascophyllum nodosum]